jgi:UDP-arabinose 4-epimerase
VPFGPLIEGDILDREALLAAMRQTQPDVVAHFAAFAYVGESVSDPAIYYRNYTVGALNVLDAMRGAGVGALLFSSTCATYGEPDYTPIDEAHPQRPMNPYGRSKLMVEHMLADHAAAYGLNAVALRYFNAAGADPSGEVGERHEPETHVIPLAIRGVMDGGYTFNILGADYPTRDGTAVRDYIHVTDLADAHRRALDYVRLTKGFDVFNLGTGDGVTVKEVADAVERVAGAPLRRAIAPRRAGDPAALVANAAKAERVLGWRPTHSDITTIVETAWAWRQRDGAGKADAPHPSDAAPS